MKNILITGSIGQIGSKLTMKLCREYQNGSVVAGYIAVMPPKGELFESSPAELADITDSVQLAAIVDKYKVDIIYNLAVLPNATAEAKPQSAWHIGLGGPFNVLEIAREKGCAIFTSSSTEAFGNEIPKDKTPQDTIQRPKTMYGVTKVAGELLSDCYHERFGVDTRSVRFPGLISNVMLPGSGTTDYTVEIYYAAIKEGKFVCPIKEGTYMDMMYTPDALHAMVQFTEADPTRLIYRNSSNIVSMSFEPGQIVAAVKHITPDFETSYDVDPLHQAIAESRFNSLDDSCACCEWDWQPHCDLDIMSQDTIQVLRARYGK